MKDPVRAQRQLARSGDNVKVPLFVQGGIHGNEYEGVDAAMQVIEKLATTPYGADPEVDLVLDRSWSCSTSIQNPDGRVAGTRGERQRVRPQPRLPHAVAVRDEGRGRDHAGVAAAGHARPARLRDADARRGTTKPHNPSIEYDLWLKWNQGRIDANRAALTEEGLGITRPVLDWCATATSPARAGCATTATRPGRRSPRAGTTGARSTPRCTPSTSASTPPRSRCATRPTGLRRAGRDACRRQAGPPRLAPRAGAGDLVDAGLRRRATAARCWRPARVLPPGRGQRAAAGVLPAAVRRGQQLDARVPEGVRDPDGRGAAQRARGQPARRLAAHQRRRGRGGPAGLPLRRRSTTTRARTSSG